MNTPQQHYAYDAYLDVTEFILTEHNPDDSSQQMPTPTIQITVDVGALTPGSYPIALQGSTISPLLKGLYKGEPPSEFSLTLEFTTEPPRRRSNRRKNTVSMYWMPMHEELGDISEENNEQNLSEEDSEEPESESESSQESQEQSASAPSNPVPHLSRLDTLNFDFQTAQQAKQQQRLEQQEFRQNLQVLSNKGEIKDLVAYLSRFLTEDEIIQLSPVTQRTEDIIALVNSKIRRIGRLSAMERKFRVQRYLQKRKNRIWGKKISYDCRKRVADARLRIKGRFITRKQASKILEMDVSHMTQDQIKNLLDQKLNRKEIEQQRLNELLKL